MIDQADQGDYNFDYVDKSLAVTDVKHMHDVARLLYHTSDHDNIQVLDARSAERFSGTGSERPGVRHGSIQHSINVPFNFLVNKDGTLKSTEEIDAIFK